jgi:beta-lactam-binding protein with PASTA domain
MSFIKFITSKTFFIQLALAIVAIVVIVFITLQWISSSTNQGEFKIVPELTGKSINTAKIELENQDLVMVIQDSANFNPDYPRFSVIEQDPVAKSKVKENRKIYLTLNPSGYRKVEIPDLIQRTFRQAKPSIEAIGFKVGKKRYVDNIGKDVVLGLEYKGKPLEAGTKLPKTAVIDFVLGNGNRPGSVSNGDDTGNDVEEVETN